MASASALSKELTIVKYLDLEHAPNKTVVLVKRNSDGETLLGHLLDTSIKPKQFLDMFDNSPAGDILKRLLNHENILSIAGEVPGAKGRYCVSDHCDAGTLDDMLHAPPTPRTSTGFIPPSLCWHVLVSLLRALAWLHDGYREDWDRFKGAADMDDDGDVQSGGIQDPDWLSVLHCNISPENIFLQRPRGSETYGLVKLGNFSSAHLATHVRGSVGALVAFDENDVPSSELLEDFRDGDFDRISSDTLFYTRGSDLQAVGAILYRMMTGKALPPPNQCPEPGCGCYHREPGAEPCPHDCYENVDLSSKENCWGLFSELTDYHGRYRDKELGIEVGRLLAMDPKSGRPDSTVSVYQAARAAHEHWLQDHPDGQLIVTLGHDLADRQRRARKEVKRLTDAEDRMKALIEADRQANGVII